MEPAGAPAVFRVVRSRYREALGNSPRRSVSTPLAAPHRRRAPGAIYARRRLAPRSGVSMDLRVIGEWIDEQEWLETAANVTQAGVKGFFNALGEARRPIKNFLNGTWLGHPLHPVATDIPLGAWTVTLLLDAIENGDRRSGLARAADASLALGLAGAAASAVSGLTDWSDTDARPRRVGMAHAILNVGGTLLFAGSLFSRKKGCRMTGKTLAIAGYLSIITAAYFGGQL